MSSPEVCVSTKKSPWGIIKQWIIIPGIGGMTFAIIEHLASDEMHGQTFLQSLLVSSTFWSVLANGNGIIVDWLDKRWTWLESPVRRVIIGVSALLIYTVIASLFILYAYIEWVLDYSFYKVIESQGVMAMLSLPIGITVFIALFQHGQGFLLEWRQAAIDVERLKNENLKSKFETLKTQVNPHFLFNSLNALTSLVYADQSKAVEFIQKLSQVYRYVLDHQNDEVVPLQTEVDFLKSFVYLNTIRFGDNFEVTYVNMDDFKSSETIPPVTLQMLIENCIKHNEISKKNQLKISVERKNGEVVVTNNINPITSAKQDSSGLGLSNIISRYEMLSDKKVEVRESADTFEVVVPILSLS